MKNLRKVEKENKQKPIDQEANISSSPDNMKTARMPPSLSDSLIKKMEISFYQKQRDATAANIEALFNPRQTSPQAGHQAVSIQKAQRLNTPPKKDVADILKRVQSSKTDKVSDCPTLQKQFQSRVNPITRKRQVQKKEGFIWFACYNEMVGADVFASVLKSLPKDLRKFPTESLHLHIKDFELWYGSNQQQNPALVQPCVRRVAGKVLFVQVHLIEVK